MYRVIQSSVNADYDIVELPQFKKQAKRLKLTDADIAELKQKLIDEEPEANLGSNVYKFRWVPSRWNTSQRDARVIYIDIIKDSKAYLVSMYTKKDKSDLTPDELKNVRKLGKLLGKGGKA